MMRSLQQTAAGILRPPPALTPDQWADQYRILPPESAEPGRWRTARTPYMIPIMRAISSPRYDTIVVVMGSQMGKTEGLFNAILSQFDLGPARPALYIGPSEKNVRSISSGRILKAMQSIPSLWAKVAKGQKLKITEYNIAGVRFGMAWAGSATELASHPVAIVLVDELDRMEQDVRGEGDPVTLARARTKTYSNSKVIIASTPTAEFASPIWTQYEAGTMGKWSVPCPECGELFTPRLALLSWPKGAPSAEIRAEARMACEVCGAALEDRHKGAMNAGGVFRFHALGADGEHILLSDEPNNRTASFWVSGSMSPWQTFGELAVVMAEAYKSGAPERIKSATNTYAGEIFREKGAAPKWAEVAALRGAYERKIIPDGVQLITSGVDVQKRGLYFVVRGWGFNAESWLLDHGYIPGESEFDNVWIMLARLLDLTYLSEGRRIERMFIDSGYRPGDKARRPEHQVYKFSRRFPGLVFATKGHDTLDRTLKPARIDYTQGGRVIKNGIQLWHLNTDALKSWIHARIYWPEGEPGGFHLHRETDDDYCQQLVAEEVVTHASGRRGWVLRSRDNHYLDCEVNALAAALTLQVETLPPTPPPPKSQPQSSKQREPFIKSPKSGFIRG